MKRSRKSAAARARSAKARPSFPERLRNFVAGRLGVPRSVPSKRDGWIN